MIRFDSMPLAMQEALCTPMHVILPPTHAPPRTGALFLGSLAAVNERDALRAHDITHVVQVLDAAWHAFSSAAAQLDVYTIDIADQSSADLKPHLDAVCAHIDAALGAGKSVLVHCQQGISRSAAVVIAYLIRYRGMSYDAALALVRRQRACVKPNPGFVQALKEWEAASHRPTVGRRFTT